MSQGALRPVSSETQLQNEKLAGNMKYDQQQFTSSGSAGEHPLVAPLVEAQAENCTIENENGKGDQVEPPCLVDQGIGRDDQIVHSNGISIQQLGHNPCQCPPGHGGSEPSSSSTRTPIPPIFALALGDVAQIEGEPESRDLLQSLDGQLLVVSAAPSHTSDAKRRRLDESIQMHINLDDAEAWEPLAEESAQHDDPRPSQDEPVDGLVRSAETTTPTVSTPPNMENAAATSPTVANQGSYLLSFLKLKTAKMAASTRWMEHLARQGSATSARPPAVQETPVSDQSTYSRTHPSHHHMALRCIVFCRKCGDSMFKKPLSLVRPCPGQPPHNDCRGKLKRMMKGLHPEPKVQCWPEGTPTSHIDQPINPDGG